MASDNGPHRMLHWLGVAARDARIAGNRKLAHIAVEVNVGEDTIRRFELGHQWPRDPDRTIAAYARVLGLDEVDLWAEALRRWRQEL